MYCIVIAIAMVIIENYFLQSENGKTEPTHVHFESSEEADTSRSCPKKKKKKKKHKQYVVLSNVITCIYSQGDNEKK